MEWDYSYPTADFYYLWYLTDVDNKYYPWMPGVIDSTWSASRVNSYGGPPDDFAGEYTFSFTWDGVSGAFIVELYGTWYYSAEGDDYLRFRIFDNPSSPPPPWTDTVYVGGDGQQHGMLTSYPSTYVDWQITFAGSP